MMTRSSTDIIENMSFIPFPDNSGDWWDIDYSNVLCSYKFTKDQIEQIIVPYLQIGMVFKTTNEIKELISYMIILFSAGKTVEQTKNLVRYMSVAPLGSEIIDILYKLNMAILEEERIDIIKKFPKYLVNECVVLADNYYLLDEIMSKLEVTIVK